MMIGCLRINDIMCTPSSIPPKNQRGVLAWWQIVGRVARPDLGGERVAVLRPHAALNNLPRNDCTLHLCERNVHAQRYQVLADFRERACHALG